MEIPLWCMYNYVSKAPHPLILPAWLRTLPSLLNG